VSIVSQYTRSQWEARDEWRGVENYINGVELLFFADYDEDEDTEVERAEEIVTFEGKVFKVITTTATRPYRFYRRDEHGFWYLEDQGKRVVEDKIALGMGRSEGQQ
jgi:hypothetical protein